MHVEINETNIDKFGLVKLTGNSREVLLSRAAEAAESGYLLSFNIPDDLIHQNVFDIAESMEVDDPLPLGEEPWMIHFVATGHTFTKEHGFDSCQFCDWTDRG